MHYFGANFCEYAVKPPDGVRPKQNGANADYSFVNDPIHETPFHVDCNEISEDMGAIPRAILNIKERQRGRHPLNSFTAIGPNAKEIIKDQTPADVFAPIKRIVALNGYILLMGVGLNRMTLIHEAERQAGRNLFIRWANDSTGKIIETRTGGCSEGFFNLNEALLPLAKEVTVGKSIWNIFKAEQALKKTIEMIKKDPSITHCDNVNCSRCNDAMLGGPLY